MSPLDTIAAASRAAPAAPALTDDARLRQACAQLEGVFLEQLMKALRETVPEGGLIDGGAGEDIFSSLLDGQLSAAAASRLERGLGAALYRQFRAGPAAEAAAAPTPFASVEVRRP
jgi:flagellar protein FlgJ